MADWGIFLLESRRWMLTHWGWVTHICVSKLTIIGSENGLSPDRRQAVIWTNVEILLIRTLGTNLSEILIEIQTFSFKKMHLKMSSGKWRPFCLGLNVLSTRPCWQKVNIVSAIAWASVDCWPSSMSPYGVTRPQWVRVTSFLGHQVHIHVYGSTMIPMAIVILQCLHTFIWIDLTLMGIILYQICKQHEISLVSRHCIVKSVI